MDQVPTNRVEEQDWNTFIIENLIQPSLTMVASDLKEFTVINGELYFKELAKF